MTEVRLLKVLLMAALGLNAVNAAVFIKWQAALAKKNTHLAELSSMLLNKIVEQAPHIMNDPELEELLFKIQAEMILNENGIR